MKLLTAILVLTLITLARLEDCNNPLLSVFDFEGLSSPTQHDALDYCSNLQGKTACCEKDTINNFQDKVDEAIDNLQGRAEDRDSFFEDVKSEDFEDLVEDWDSYNNNLQDIREKNSDLAEAIITKFGPITTSIPQVIQEVNDLGPQFTNYQNARAQCFTTMIDTQASAYCLACDPRYAERGLNQDGTINLSEDLCTRMKVACYPYLVQADKFSIFASIKKYKSIIQQLKDFVDDLDTGDSESITKVQTAEPITSEWDPEDNFERETQLPAGCTSQNDCNWICTDMFVKGIVLNDVLGLGGIPLGSLSEEDTITMVDKLAKDGGRLLQDVDINIVAEENEEDPAAGTVEVEDMPDDQVAAQEDVPTNNQPQSVWDPPVNEAGTEIEIDPNPTDVSEDDMAETESAFHLGCGTTGVALLSAALLYIL